SSSTIGRCGRSWFGSSFSLFGDLFKRNPGGTKKRSSPGARLPALNNHVRIGWIDLQRIGLATSFFGGDYGCAAASKWIEHKIGSARGVSENVSDEGNWFDGGVAGELVKPACFKRIHPGIIPNIGSVATMPAEFDVIDMGRATDFEHGDEFVFGSVK